MPETPISFRAREELDSSLNREEQLEKLTGLPFAIAYLKEAFKSLRSNTPADVTPQFVNEDRSGKPEAQLFVMNGDTKRR